jgi:MFS family permease
MSPNNHIYAQTVHLSRHYDDEVYTLFSRPRKLLIVSIVAFYGFLSPFSSISILAASPELASSFNTTEIIINVSNAVYMVSMGLSAPFWAPLSQIYGRRLVHHFHLNLSERVNI